MFLRFFTTETGHMLHACNLVIFLMDDAFLRNVKLTSTVKVYYLNSQPKFKTLIPKYQVVVKISTNIMIKMMATGTRNTYRFLLIH